MALSLNKAFSAAGGALVVSAPSTKVVIRASGSTMAFSGPIQAPMLDAAVACAKLHLTRELESLQADLLDKIRLVRSLAGELGVQLIADDLTPIFMLPYESSAETRLAARRFWSAGFYVCPVSYPAVPMSHPGIRFTICRTNEADDISAFLTVARRLQASRQLATA